MSDTDSNGHRRDYSLPRRTITVAEAIDRVRHWADFHKDARCNVDDWPSCDRSLDEVVALMRNLERQITAS
jgi:hypothetical protein